MKIIVLSGSSGSGKTTLCRMVKDRLGFFYGISHTTRPMRPKEKNGVDYFFVSKKEFEKMIQEGEFIEYAQVYNNYYGTSKKMIEDALSEGKNVILDLDIQGAFQIKKIFPQSKLIYIKVADIDTLKERLIQRSSDDMGVLQERLQQVENEEKMASKFDTILLNNDLELCYTDLEGLLKNQ